MSVLPETIGHYRIIREVGRGGMATVYLAQDTNFDRQVAIKVLPRQFSHDPKFRARFARETQTIARLEHPSIVPVYDTGEEDDVPYLVMRYMPGGTLTSRIAQGPMDVPQATAILRPVAAALDYAHQQGVIHRDVKPGNILFDLNGTTYLSDFGIVRLAEETQSLIGSKLVGTPAYMSPEQVDGKRKIDGRSDMYALAIVCYEMLSGEVPYKGETPTQQLMQHVLEPVPQIRRVRPDVPEAVERELMRGLAKEPEHRFPTAKALVTGLEQPESSPQSTKYGPPTSAETPARTSSYSKDYESLPDLPRRKGSSLLWNVSIGAAISLLVCLSVAVALQIPGLLPPVPWPPGVPSPTVIATVNEPATEAPEAAIPDTDTPVPTTITPTFTHTYTPTSTPTPTETATPTSTPTPTETATPTSTATPTPTPIPRVRPSGGGANVRSGPGTDYDVIGALGQGETAVVLAKTNDSWWYNVQLKNGMLGWISSSVVEPVTPGADVPVVVTIPAPPPTKTPTPTPTVKIKIYAEREEIKQGECTDLDWKIENVDEVYLDGKNVVPDDDQKVCPTTTTTYEFHIVKLDGSTETRTVTVEVIIPKPAPPQPSPPPASHFDGTTKEGWRLSEVGTLTNPGNGGSGGGANNGFLLANLGSEGRTSYYIAPSKYHGDWSSYSAIRLALASSGGDYYRSGYSMYGDIYLANGRMNAQRLLPRRPEWTWETFYVPLTNDGRWILGGGATSLESVLNNVTGFEVRAEYGVGEDKSGLDNIELVR